uniref:Uncharacterized protein n=1 Tax=Bionectria ochroleuca TaxID=29856 RepID=A0A8H7NBU7_BIOOC
MSFYRVKVPCYFKEVGVPAQQVTLYLHPELDILRLSGLKYFARFAHMIWNLDHHHIGLVNVALPSDAIYEANTHYDELFQEVDDQDILRQALARLRSVIFGYDGTLGRAMPHTAAFDWGGRTELSRARPLLASVSRFERLPQDPRPIEQDLKRVYLPLGDPREQIYRWFRLLDKWEISNDERPVKYRFMITCGDKRVETREEARMSLRQEKRMWKRGKNFPTKAAREGAFQDDDRALPSAYGFWLFPIDAFGKIPEAHPDIRHKGILKKRDLRKPANVWRLKRLWDLSIQKPELCLQHLPSRPQPISTGRDSKRPSWRSYRSK